MNKATSDILKMLQDCVEFEGYTQGLSLLINHKLSHDERHLVIDEISNILNADNKI